MDLRKGFFRLTLVFSVLVVVITLVLFLDDHRYKVYQVKRERAGESPRTITFRWDEKRPPNESDYKIIFFLEEDEKS